jgi:hypothetical protein
MGWDGQRSKEYYDYIGKLKELVDESLGFEQWYTETMLSKFTTSDKAEVLIVHNVKDETKKFLKEKFENYHSVLVTDSDLVDDTYDVTMNFKNENYTEKVLFLLANWLIKNVVEDAKEQDAEK